MQVSFRDSQNIYLIDFLCYNKSMNEAEQVKQKIQNYFSQKDEIDTVLLFGSFAKGTFNSHSDIDIALHSKNSLGYEELSKIQ